MQLSLSKYVSRFNQAVVVNWLLEQCVLCVAIDSKTVDISRQT